MNKHYFGAHVTIQNGYKQAVDEIIKYNGNAIQIFLTPPRSNQMKRRSDKEYIDFGKHLKKKDCIAVVHSSYLINLARNWEPSSWWIQNLLREIEVADKFNAYGIVVHFGKSLDLTLEESYNNMFTALLYILNETKDCKVPLFMEMTAGQGTETGTGISGVKRLFQKIDKIKDKKIRSRLGICFDSCHAFASGIELRKTEDVKKFFKNFNKEIGLENLKLIHLNDSKVELGERKDRHENIGKGKLGVYGIHKIFKLAEKLKIPCILETPNLGYKTEIKKLKKKN